MSDKPDIGGEVFTIPWESVKAVLWSEDELDGIHFEEDKEGVTVMYAYGGMWTLNLFLLALAKETAPIVRPDLEGFSQIYHTLAELTMDMSFPVAAPQRGEDDFYCRLPNIRIIPRPTSNPTSN